MSLFFGEYVLFGKKGSRIIDSSDSSFTANGSGENPAESPMYILDSIFSDQRPNDVMN
jgi:hypothetical protein